MTRAGTTGRALSFRRAIGPNVLSLGVVSLLNDTSSEMIYPLLPVFLTTVLGANVAFVGLVEGAAESATSLFKLGSGWLSDRFGRRKPLVFGGYGIAALCRPALAATTAAWQVLALRVVDRTGKGLRGAPRDALIAESVSRENLGLAFGFHRAMDHAGAVAGPLLAMALLALLGENLRLLFLLAAVPGLASAAMVALRVREMRAAAQPAAPANIAPRKATLPIEPRRAAPPVDGNANTRVRHEGAMGGKGEAVAGTGDAAESTGWRRRLRGQFGLYLIALTLFSLGNSSDAFLILRARDLGVPIHLVPAIWVILNAVKALSSTPGGYIADRFGRKSVLLGGWLLYFVTYLGFAGASSATSVVILFAVYGVYFGLAEGTEKALVAELATTGRGTAYGFYYLAVGATALPASLIFGLVWERWSAQTAFLMGAGLALAASAVLLTVRVGSKVRA